MAGTPLDGQGWSGPGLDDRSIAVEIANQAAEAHFPDATGDQTITGDWDFAAALTNEGSPVATKPYVDALQSGLAPLAACDACTTGNVDLTAGGLLTVDGVVLTDGMRVFVPFQTNKTQNGLYSAHSGAWIRTTDADQTGELKTGTLVDIKAGGTSYGGSEWICTTTGTITIGTTAITFSPRPGVYSVNGRNGSVVGVLDASDNLASLADVSAARSNLGLGSASIHPASDFDAAGTAAAATPGVYHPFSYSGATDDVKIQAAINAASTAGGGIVDLRGYNWVLATSLVPKSGVTLLGDRIHTVSMSVNSNAIDGRNASCTDFSVDGVVFVGSVNQTVTVPTRARTTSGAGAQTAIFISGDADTSASNVGVFTNLTITNCIFRNHSALPIRIGGVHGVVRCTGNEFTNNQDVGFLFNEEVIFVGNHIKMSADNGVSLSRGNIKMTCTGNTIENACFNGIFVSGFSTDKGPTKFSVTGNTVINVGNSGVRLEGAPKHGVVTGNYIEQGYNRGPVDSVTDSGCCGILFHGYPLSDPSAPTDFASDIVVAGNTIHASARAGIYVNGVAGLRIEANMISDTGTHFLADGTTAIASNDTTQNIGILIDYPTTTSGLDIRGNTIIDQRVTPYTNYGIYPLVVTDMQTFGNRMKGCRNSPNLLSYVADKLGIGTSNPGQLVEISSTGTAPVLRFSKTDGTANSWDVGFVSGSTAMVVQPTNNANLAFKDASAANVMVLDTGAKTLTLSGSATATALTVSAAGSSSKVRISKSDATTNDWDIGYLSGSTSLIIRPTTNANLAIQNAAGTTNMVLLDTNAATLTVADGLNLIVGSTTGTQIGTSNTQKLGFFGATPIGQPGSTAELRALLVNLGLLATGGANPLNLNGGTFTAPLHQGDIASGGTLTLSSTSNATKGKILLGTSAYDEVNDRLGVGLSTPLQKMHISGTGATSVIRLSKSDATTNDWDIGYLSSSTALVFQPTTSAILAFKDSSSNNIFSFDVGGKTLTLFAATNIVVGTTTGTKIGTATSQKLGFFNATPIIQPSGSAEAAVVTTASTNITPYGFTTSAQADAIVTLVNEIRNVLVNLGLMKGSA